MHMNSENGLIKKLALVFVVLFLLQFIVEGFILRRIALNQTEQQLKKSIARVKEDITYNNNRWDMRRYNADPNVPDSYPLYILSTDGFILDRWKPVRGYLDVSDIKHLLTYQPPKTINTPTGQTWRVFSKPIVQNGETLGVVTVGAFEPQGNISDIDSQLENVASFVFSKITIQNGQIEAKNLDVRDVSYNISFQVVDKYNRILSKNNNTNSIDRIPNYIDLSYIGEELNSSPIKQVQDSVTRESFLIATEPIVNKQQTVIGLIVMGKSILSINQIYYTYFVTEAVTAGITIIIALYIAYRLIKNYLKNAPHKQIEKKEEVEKISFDKKASVLHVGSQEIAIPYGTNQYYFLEALFSNSKKHWEVDELLERFGEDPFSNNWRKVYDAMTILNKKAAEFLPTKLITLQDKTYYINPQLLPKLTSHTS